MVSHQKMVALGAGCPPSLAMPLMRSLVTVGLRSVDLARQSSGEKLSYNLAILAAK